MTEQKKQTKALTTVDALRQSLKVMEPEFAAVLPSNIPPEKFTRVAMTAIQLRPELANVDRRSLFGELLRCATDGLVPDGREATINTYANTAKYIPMIGGICKKARNSGLIKTIDAVVVYENDTYESWIDEKGPHFKFMRGRGDRGKVRLTFAYAITNQDEGFFLEEIDEAQMSSIESSSKAKTGPWKGPFRDEMRRKSALRRLAKYRLPSSADLEKVVERDNDLFDLEAKPEAAPEKKEGPSRLKSFINATDDVQEATTTTTIEPGDAQDPVEPEVVNPPKNSEPPI